jgi:hypothetical protein
LAERGGEVLFDGEETIRAESVSPIEAEGVEDAASDIDRRSVSKGCVQGPDSSGEQTGTEPYTTKEEAAFVRLPHDRDGLESLAKKSGWRGPPSSLALINFGSLCLKMSVLLCFAFDSAQFLTIVVMESPDESGEVAFIVVMESPDESGEVAFSVTDIVAVNLGAKGPLGPMEDFQGVATQ